MNRYTRRDVIRMGGSGALGITLAACGVGGKRGSGDAPKLSELPPLARQLSIAQWPLYIDKKVLRTFEEESGIDVRYKEIITDNQAFFATLQEPLSAGASTGWDLVALSDWVVAKMNRLGYIEPLHHELLPNVTANLSESFRDPNYDPGNEHSIPWQGGITGVAYDRKRVGRELTRFEDLWDPALEGHVGMLTEMVDTMNLTLLTMGIDPQEATVSDAELARDRLLEQRDAGIVRGYFGNDYIDGLARGDLWASMAWSGDIFWLGQDNPDISFFVPEEGGLLWATPLEIPVGAEHPRDAHAFLDYCYDLEVAADITEWVGYITPVDGVQDVLRGRAQAATEPEDQAFLEALAASEYVFPSDEMKSNLYTYKILDEDEEQRWNDLFGEVIQG